MTPTSKSDPARKGKPQATTGSAAKTDDVDAFLASQDHPRLRDILAVRKALRGVDAAIREEVKWNSVSFRNDHDFFATVNLRATDAVQLIFYTGVKPKRTAVTGVQVADPSGLVTKWAAKDRCVVSLGSGTALRAKLPALCAFAKEWLRFVTTEAAKAQRASKVGTRSKVEHASDPSAPRVRRGART